MTTENQIQDTEKQKKRDAWNRWYKSNKERELARQRTKRENYTDENKERIHAKRKEYLQVNKDRLAHKQREYVQANRERILRYQKEYREANIEQMRPKREAYAQTNKELIRIKQKEYRFVNKERLKEERKDRMKSDELYCAKMKLRGMCMGAFQRIKMNKPTDTLSLLGCSWQEAKAHIESLFQPGMNWSNHGKGPDKWHIDHIKPVASFTPGDVDQMNHYTNLQPLWQSENLHKGCKYIL
jgi:hypothetical protein